MLLLASAILGACREAPSCATPSLVSQDKPVTASASPAAASAVTDGAWDVGNWNAETDAPQWIEIDLLADHIVRYISLNPEQTPAGVTRHEVRGRGSSGESRVLGTIHQWTQSGGWYTVALGDDEGRGLRRIHVHTLSTPSWVSWREIQVFGCASQGAF
jgi:hypothetical protein